MATTFQVSLVKSNQALYPLPHGVYAPVGDARRTPNYKLGHGLNDALQCGVEFARCIRRDGGLFDQERYQALVDKVDQNFDKKTAFIQQDSSSDPSTDGESADDPETPTHGR